jgi:predicted glycosyltransferase
VRGWIDVDNPPQAVYLLPFVRRFEQAGDGVLLTARAYGDTFAILESEGVRFTPIGASFGKGRARKLLGLAKRVRVLVRHLREAPTRPDFVLTGSRAAVLAARRLGIPSFVILDYEYVDLHVYRLAGSTILHPSVIDADAFRGIPLERSLPFAGLKEDISFADVEFTAVPPYDFAGREPSGVRVLFRPPAEESHYFRSESRELAVAVLRFLAPQQATVVFSPRYDWQLGYLADIPHWEREPVILRKPVPFVSLLKAVDAVVSAGGTMLREAAYLGVPAYSIFRGRIGAVDRYLASIGRLVLLSSEADFGLMRMKGAGPLSPLRGDAGVADEVARLILERTGASLRRPPG